MVCKPLLINFVGEPLTTLYVKSIKELMELEKTGAELTPEETERLEAHNADYYGIPLMPIYKNTIRIQYLNLEIFVGRKNSCVRTHIDV